MILIVDLNWKKDSLGFYEFVLPITSIAAELEEYMVKHYLEVNNNDINRCDKVILSGTALKDNVTLNQPEKFSWLSNLDKPVLGVCAGMQTIGVVFGLRLMCCLEIGMTEVTTLKENPLFSNTFRAYSLHNYSVEPLGDFDVLAESAQCPQAIKHRKKPIYGVLFHPEVRNEDILKRFIQSKQ
jgi:GMP synthase-like glutamine amidotransferase